jgi:hypothetical protein
MKNDIKTRVDVKAISKALRLRHKDIGTSELVAYAMRKSGATYQEIADAFGSTKQGAHYSVNRVQKKLGGDVHE